MERAFTHMVLQRAALIRKKRTPGIFAVKQIKLIAVISVA